MTPRAWPVFGKDLRALLRMIPGFAAVQVGYSVIAGLVLLLLDEPHPWASAGWVMLMAAWILGQGYGLFAATFFRAEERDRGTEAFLRRLPASTLRIGGEKVAAGLTAVVAFGLMQVLFHLATLPFGGLWPPPAVAGTGTPEGWPWSSAASIAGFFALTWTTSYAVGLLVSTVLRQGLVIVLVGFAAWWAVGSLFMVGLAAVPWEALVLNVVVFTPLVVAVLVMALPERRLPGLRLPVGGPARAPWLRLLGKGLAENGMLQAACLLYLAVALVLPTADFWAVGATGMVLVAALGAGAYPLVEKRGVDCVLHHHPVPMATLFWTKVGAALPGVLAVSLGIWLILSRQENLPFASVALLCAFLYLCGVLMALTVERPVTALLATGCVVATTVITPLTLGELLAPRWLLQHLPGLPSGDLGVPLLGAASLPLGLLALGCLEAARRMATDRRTRTGSPRRRGLRFLALYVLVLGVTVVGTALGWRVVG